MGFIWTFTATVVFGCALSAVAQLDDALVDAENFAKPFGPLVVAVTGEGEGYARLSRQEAGADAGVDWMVGGKERLELRPEFDFLLVEPMKADHGAFLVISLLFFDAQGSFLAEEVWVEDTNKLDTLKLSSVKAFADKKGVADAAAYQVRLRVNPIESNDASFSIKRIAAIEAAPAAEPQ